MCFNLKFFYMRREDNDLRSKIQEEFINLTR
jgi:hypothetical protein